MHKITNLWKILLNIGHRSCMGILKEKEHPYCTTRCVFQMTEKASGRSILVFKWEITSSQNTVTSAEEPFPEVCCDKTEHGIIHCEFEPVCIVCLCLAEDIRSASKRSGFTHYRCWRRKLSLLKVLVIKSQFRCNLRQWSVCVPMRFVFPSSNVHWSV